MDASVKLHHYSSQDRVLIRCVSSPIVLALLTSDHMLGSLVHVGRRRFFRPGLSKRDGFCRKPSFSRHLSSCGWDAHLQNNTSCSIPRLARWKSILCMDLLEKSELNKKGQNSRNKSQFFWLKGQVESRACPAARGAEQIDARPCGANWRATPEMKSARRRRGPGTTVL